MDEQNPSVNTDPAAEQRARELRVEIDRTRADMSETVNAIQDRLRPSAMASNAAESVKHAAMSKVRDVADSEPVSYMAANPVPMTMVAIGVVGLAWLATAGNSPREALYSRSNGRGDNYVPRRDWRPALDYDRTVDYDGTGGAERGAGYDRATDYETTAGMPSASYPQHEWSGAGEYSAPYGEGATGDYGRQSRPAQMPGANLQRLWRKSPLMIGAAAAVAGAVVAMALPETERENELMGETRDRMIESVQGTVRDKVDQVQQAATTALSSVQDAARDALGTGKSDTSDDRQDRAGMGTGV